MYCTVFCFSNYTHFSDHGIIKGLIFLLIHFLITIDVADYCVKTISYIIITSIKLCKKLFFYFVTITVTKYFGAKKCLIIHICLKFIKVKNNTVADR